MTAYDAPVGIVGAGPIGLVAALRLADLGVPSVLLEASPELLKQGSKACLIQGDVLDVLDKSGCADQIKDEGVTWTVARTYVRNKVIRSAEYPLGPGFGPFVNISQHRIEQVLAEAAEAHPLCDLRWGQEVVGVSQDADGVTVRVNGEEGERSLRFAHLVACDGVRSTLREMLGVRWTGYTHKDRFLITDIRAKLPLAKERHFHYDPPFNPGRQLVMHPQPDDIWRIDWQLPPDADIEAERADGRFDRRVRDVIGDIPYEIDWVSTYRFHQRVVERLRVGRVLFAGDAAHALPPYGSRGMNSGIQDADNLAWKLALVHAGHADEELLETYHTERYAAAKENLRVTEATIRFMVPPNLARRWARSALLTLSHAFGRAQKHVNSGRMAEPYVYTESPLVQAADDDALLGSFAPDGHVEVVSGPEGHPHEDGGRTRLRRLLGDGFVGLCFAPDAARAAALVRGARVQPWRVPARLVVVLPWGAATEGLPADIHVVRTKEASLLKTYGAERGTWYLARPDGHLAARSTRGSDFAAALDRAAGAPARTRPLVKGTL
ncbi:FAD-dependent monooxygenase [Streptomyces sp. NBC_00237]|uniref:FAD-dependent monooxygenase n=1 Tax=Streptomyces sp. NBC_00237 TaxID=2975687 RepID=UPI002251B35A|nr:FAD-dependent monooxygenase [Streptomyces sp. NBC_00237]MCX5206809.1 FAD-dependent monooxygenase [Streptomyces sp. NBC_00237]